MLANNKIKYNTDTIGFFVIIIEIPEIIAIIAIKSKKLVEYPLYKSGITYRLNIKKSIYILSLYKYLKL